MLDIQDDDKEAIKSFKELLSFYGVELQSHASIILSLMVVIFAIVQAWGGLPERFQSDGFHSFWFAVIVGVVSAGIVYQLWRLYAFGKLTSGITYCSDSAWNKARAQWNEGVKNTTIKGEDWSHLFDMTKAVIYAEGMLKSNSERVRNFRLLGLAPSGGRVRLRPRMLAVGFLAGFFVSYVLVFGELGLACIVYTVLLGVLIRVGYRARRGIVGLAMKVLDLVP